VKNSQPTQKIQAGGENLLPGLFAADRRLAVAALQAIVAEETVDAALNRDEARVRRQQRPLARNRGRISQAIACSIDRDDLFTLQLWRDIARGIGRVEQQPLDLAMRRGKSTGAHPS